MNLFWIFMIVVNMMIPSSMLIFGLVFSKKAPQRINAFYGYRTEASMKNSDTWKFSHQYFGNIWTKLSILMFIITFIWMMFLFNETNTNISLYGFLLTFIQLVLMITPIFMTEKALRNNFDADGHRIAIKELPKP